MPDPTPEMIEAARLWLPRYAMNESRVAKPERGALQAEYTREALSAALAAVSKEWLLAQALTEGQINALIYLLGEADAELPDGLQGSASLARLLPAALALSTEGKDDG